MSKNLQLPSAPTKTILRFLRVKRAGKEYKVFAKDILQLIKRKKRVNRPPVPAFDAVGNRCYSLQRKESTETRGSEMNESRQVGEVGEIVGDVAPLPLEIVSPA